MKAPAFQYPNAHVTLDPMAYLSSPYVMSLSAKEEGQLIQEIAIACANGDVETLEKYDFLGRFYKGSTTVFRPAIPAQVRRDVLSAGRCAECSATERLEVDHIIPFSRGGSHDRSNLQALCRHCNVRKGARI